MVSVHAASVLFGYCAGDTGCTASVYFGLPTVPTLPPVTIDSSSSLTTTSYVSANVFAMRDIHALVQVTGLYALLLGVTVLILLEVAELRLLQNRPKKARRA
jgi:hypothetical protein